MTEKILTCIVCPMGCNLKVTLSGDKVESVTGNTCKRGEAYGRTEFTDPRRTVTTTIRCSNGDVLPVKTDAPIPKDMVLECMKKINSSVAVLPVKIGDVIIKDVYGSNIVATKNLSC